MVGTMNVHIRNISNRNYLVGLVDLVKLDVLVVTETWFDYDTSSKIMSNAFGNGFYWFGSESKNQKSSSGSGGIGILIRKSCGSPSLLKVYKNFPGIWIKLCKGENIYYICGVYIPPHGSPQLKIDFDEVLEELRLDIVLYNNIGKVILLGDFNARIGNAYSILHGINKQLCFSRVLVDCDDQKTSEAFTRGRQLIQIMNSLNMVIVNGIDSGGDYTFDDKSVIDYIIVNENIFAPSFRSNIMNSDLDDKNSGIITCDDIPIDSLYCRNSCKVWLDKIYRIGDHRLLSCQILDNTICRSRYYISGNW